MSHVAFLHLHVAIMHTSSLYCPGIILLFEMRKKIVNKITTFATKMITTITLQDAYSIYNTREFRASVFCRKKFSSAEGEQSL